MGWGEPHGPRPRSLGDGNLNLPFERTTPVDVPVDTYIAGGIVVRAGTAQLPTGRQPLLVFDFFAPDGSAYSPITLICHPDELAQLAQLVGDAARAAIEEAGR